MTQGPVYIGTGRRKSSVARVRISRGNGSIKVNGTEINKFFPTIRTLQIATAPLDLTGMTGKYDVIAKCDGGGFTGQAGAVRLGIARALLKADQSLEAKLRDEGLLTRDPREKERQKYGQKGARASYQFSKR